MKKIVLQRNLQPKEQEKKQNNEGLELKLIFKPKEEQMKNRSKELEFKHNLLLKELLKKKL